MDERSRRARFVVMALAAALLGACAPATQSPTAPTPPSNLARASAAATASGSPPASAPPAGSAVVSPALWNPPQVALALLVGGLASPVFSAGSGDGSGRVFVIEQAGRIRVVRDGTLVATPYLDLRSEIASGGERGLLGLAFSPSFATDGRLFVDYTDTQGNTVVAEVRASDPGADRADPATERGLLHIDQPFPNHNGGNLVARPDGTLWIGMGDGGSGGDPKGNGQNRDALLAKLLRIDPTAAGSAPYTIPADNPFVGVAGTRPEIWALGLRNPWRFSFDRATGDLWIGDVGQDSWEEVDRVRAGSPGGLDFGWNIMEATHCFLPSSGCATAGLTLPVAEYGHDVGCAITGGVVYRGTAIPALVGTYLYADSCSGRIWGLDAAADAPTPRLLAETGRAIVSFGETDAGDVLLTDIAGEVLRLIPAGG